MTTEANDLSADPNMKMPKRLHPRPSSRPQIHIYSDGKGHMYPTSAFQAGCTFRRSAPHIHLGDPLTGAYSADKIRGHYSVWGDDDSHHQAKKSAAQLRRQRKVSAGYVFQGHGHIRPRYRTNRRRYGHPTTDNETFED